ncbi:hypothetical protein [Streptomyces caelestis]|uniref:Uncharacterized protein n=1 Tax=Streptomyces caelestis TaxID=36816 RepID=A0A7W9LT80_9ACTN|nr:hypothetical protein [Streptomyces caelestis]MBB5795042.1 hypothetical protein [Streptomyces caelestis]GGW26641.1 hypothetical protein GCM10010320_01210 [Streptomyces caelestis]
MRAPDADEGERLFAEAVFDADFGCGVFETVFFAFVVLAAMRATSLRGREGTGEAPGVGGTGTWEPRAVAVRSGDAHRQCLFLGASGRGIVDPTNSAMKGVWGANY